MIRFLVAMTACRVRASKLRVGVVVIDTLWNLAVAAAVASIATLELLFVAYHPWLPDAAVWSTLLALDVLAVFLYMGRIDTSPELIDDLEEEGGVSREADPAVVAGP